MLSEQGTVARRVVLSTLPGLVALLLLEAFRAELRVESLSMLGRELIVELGRVLQWCH